MNTSASSRLDLALVERGLAPTRARARDAILRGHVRVNGTPAAKPAQTVPRDAEIRLDDPAARYVSRGALKLVAALDHFGYAADGRTALDIGASTGGFTQVLLERGARKVFAVDVGHGQLDPALADDARVVSREKLNARDLTPGGHRRAGGAIVADVSFISLRLVLPPALALATGDAWGVFLVKPQFEVGRAALGKGGIVRDADARRADGSRTRRHGSEPRFDWTDRRRDRLANRGRRRQPRIPDRRAAWLRR